MGNIEVNWQNTEQDILHYHFLKGWSWEEVDGAFKHGWQMMDAVSHKVDVIMNFADSSLFIPKGAFVHGQRIFNNKPHPNVRLTVLVGNHFISKMAEMIQKLLPKGLGQWDLIFAGTFDQAIEMIKNRRVGETSS